MGQVEAESLGHACPSGCSINLHLMCMLQDAGCILLHAALILLGLPYTPCHRRSLPRVGVCFGVSSELDEVQWYGRGPHECYPGGLSFGDTGGCKQLFVGVYSWTAGRVSEACRATCASLLGSAVVLAVL